MNPNSRITLRPTRAPRPWINSSLLAGCLIFGSAAQAGVLFTFDYGTDNGAGFWDATSGAARQDAMTQSAAAFSTMFASYFTNTATIVLGATATDLPSSTNLASAGSNAFGGNGAGFTVNEVVRTKVLTGVDANGTAADGFVNVNFGQQWNLTAGPTTDPDYDFYSTIFHEFTHALGFSSGINQDGTPFFGGTAAAGEWTTYDQYLVDVNGNKIIDPTTFALQQALWDAASVGGASPAGGMFFNGAYAMAANGGNPVGLYTPNPWEEGSSVSHTDDQNSAIYGTMMTAQGPTGPWPRDYSAIEVAMMRDLGYTARVVANVSEPGTYALMLAGLGLVGWSTRRRKA